MTFLRHKLTVTLLLTSLTFGLTFTTNANNLSTAPSDAVYESLEKQSNKIEQALSTSSTVLPAKTKSCGQDCYLNCTNRHHRICQSRHNECLAGRFGNAVGCAANGAIVGGIVGTFLGTVAPGIGHAAGGLAGSVTGAIGGGTGCWRSKTRECRSAFNACISDNMWVWDCADRCKKRKRRLAPKPNNNPVRRRWHWKWSHPYIFFI